MTTEKLEKAFDEPQSTEYVIEIGHPIMDGTNTVVGPDPEYPD